MCCFYFVLYEGLFIFLISSYESFVNNTVQEAGEQTLFLWGFGSIGWVPIKLEHICRKYSSLKLDGCHLFRLFPQKFPNYQYSLHYLQDTT